MYTLLVFIYLVSCLKMELYHLLAVINIDLIYTRSYFERVRSSCLFPTNGNKVFCTKKKKDKANWSRQNICETYLGVH